MFSLCESPLHTWENSFTMTLSRSASAIRRPNRMWPISLNVFLNMCAMWKPGARISPLNKLRNTSELVAPVRELAFSSMETTIGRTPSMTKTIDSMAERTSSMAQRTRSMIKRIVSMTERMLSMTKRIDLMTERILSTIERTSSMTGRKPYMTITH